MHSPILRVYNDMPWNNSHDITPPTLTFSICYGDEDLASVPIALDDSEYHLIVAALETPNSVYYTKTSGGILIRIGSGRVHFNTMPADGSSIIDCSLQVDRCVNAFSRAIVLNGAWRGGMR